jgi:(2Fe-2S) ferredoxin
MIVDAPLYYRTHLFFCTNQRSPGHERGCCADKGAERLRNYMKRRIRELGLKNIRINSAGCLDRCECGPCVVIYPEGVWYSPKSEADLDEILTVHLQQARRVERLIV